MGEMNYGKLETSEHLQRTLEVLNQGGVISTATIQRQTRSQAVHSDIAALRKNGINIKTRYLGRKNGRKRYGYELMEKAS